MPTKFPTLRRRQFLHAAAATPLVVRSGVLSAAGRRAPSDRLNTALIGSGGRGRQIIAGGDRVLAVCDVDAKHREAARLKINGLTGNSDCIEVIDFRELLARQDIDAVVIATPDHWHVPMAVAAVRAGKAVYVEKPLSLTIAQGRLLADMVSRYGAIVQVGSQQRSFEYEKFGRACELVRNGRIGQLRSVRVEIPARSGSDKLWSHRPVPPELDYERWLGPAPWAPYHPDRCHYKFRFISDYSGGDVTNWGAHHLDIAQWGLGADRSGPVEVVGHGQRNARGLHDAFYDVHVDFRYADGVTVQLRPGQRTGGVRFVGSEGWVQVSREGMQTDPPSLVDSRLGPDELHLLPPDERGIQHMQNWLDCVRLRNPKGLFAPVEIGHRSATVCHLANLAMDLGRTLRWNPETEQFVGDPDADRQRWRPVREPW